MANHHFTLRIRPIFRKEPALLFWTQMHTHPKRRIHCFIWPEPLGVELDYWLAALLPSRPRQFQGIDSGFIQATRPVQVRTSHASGGAHFGDHLASCHRITRIHSHRGAMGVKRIKPETMIKHNGVATEIQILCQNNLAGIGRLDGCARLSLSSPRRNADCGAGCSRYAAFQIHSSVGSPPARESCLAKVSEEWTFPRWLSISLIPLPHASLLSGPA